MNMRVFNNGIKLAKAVAGQAVGKISIPKLGLSINKASLKMLKDASKAGNSIATHISNSIESGQLFEFASKLLQLGEQMYSTPALQGRDADKQPITHKPVVEFGPGQDGGLDLKKIYMQGSNEKELHGWDPLSHTGTTSPSSPSAAPQGQPEPDTSQLPHRPPPGAGLNSMFQRLSQQQPSSQKARTQMPPQPAPKDTAPHSSENVHRDLEPDLGLPKEAAPEQPRQSAKPAKAEIRHALKVIREARQDRRKRIRKRRERKLARRAEKHEIALNGLKLHEERRIDTQNLLNEIRAKQQESNKRFMEDTAKNSTGFNY